MESLALLAAAITATVLLLGAIASLLSAIGWRTAGAIVGVLAMVAAGSLGWRVPQAWAIWLPPLIAGAWSFWRGRDT
jgi:hypothetical protein